jgi:sugar O-acyltransferase (sialic acid O-acetyltransferase NeuD family)
MRSLIVVGDGSVARNVDELAAVIGRRIAARVILGEAVRPEHFPDRHDIVVAVGDNDARQRIVEALLATNIPRERFPTLVHPAASVSPQARIGNGTLVLAGTRILGNATVGDFCYLNANAVVAHDCMLDPFVSLAPGAVMAGWCRLGERTSLGMNAVLRERVTVGHDCVIGALTCVLEDLPDEVVAVGIPARVLRRRVRGEPYLR